MLNNGTIEVVKMGSESCVVRTSNTERKHKVVSTSAIVPNLLMKEFLNGYTEFKNTVWVYSSENLVKSSPLKA